MDKDLLTSEGVIEEGQDSNFAAKADEEKKDDKKDDDKEEEKYYNGQQYIIIEIIDKLSFIIPIYECTNIS